MNQQQLDDILKLHHEWWETEHEPEPRGQRADLSGLDLSGLDLYHACLHGAILRGTIFRGCMLHGALIYGADLRGADLRGASYGNLFVHDSDLRGAQIDSPRKDPELGGSWDNILNFGLPLHPYEWKGTIDERIFCQLSIPFAYEGWDMRDLVNLTVLPIT